MRVLERTGLVAAVSRRLADATRVVVCGVGNELRGDDGVGLYVAQRLLALEMPSFVAVIPCGEVPENYLSEVVSHDPSHVILVDAAQAGLNPGTLVQAEEDDIWGHAVSTHRLPLSLFCRIVSRQKGARVDTFLLGVQIQSCGFGEPLSPMVREGADSLVAGLAQAFRRLEGGRRS